MKALLENVRDTPIYPYRLILALSYGCGLRVSEPLNIRVCDIDLTTARIVIRQAKGSKDRIVPIPPSRIDEIRRQIETAKSVFDRARAAEIPTKLPHRYARKNPAASRQFSWFWLFPAAFDCADPDDESGATRVWWHCLPSGVQEATRKAGARAGLPGVITPHHLRHAWATHVIDAGASVRDVQEILGHKSLETTMQYVHPETGRVPSPLESLGI